MTPLPDDPEGRYEVGSAPAPGRGEATASASEGATALLGAAFADGLDEVWCTMYARRRGLPAARRGAHRAHRPRDHA